MQPLAQFFGCTVFDIAPQLHDFLPTPPPHCSQAGVASCTAGILASYTVTTASASMSINRYSSSETSGRGLGQHRVVDKVTLSAQLLDQFANVDDVPDDDGVVHTPRQLNDRN